jgi:hypothetical protein
MSLPGDGFLAHSSGLIASLLALLMQTLQYGRSQNHPEGLCKPGFLGVTPQFTRVGKSETGNDFHFWEALVMLLLWPRNHTWRATLRCPGKACMLLNRTRPLTETADLIDACHLSLIIVQAASGSVERMGEGPLLAERNHGDHKGQNV